MNPPDMHTQRERGTGIHRRRERHPRIRSTIKSHDLESGHMHAAAATSRDESGRSKRAVHAYKESGGGKRSFGRERLLGARGELAAQCSRPSSRSH
eukprot:4231725-Pleurochrysis_carterae.AAC.1